MLINYNKISQSLIIAYEDNKMVMYHYNRMGPLMDCRIFVRLLFTKQSYNVHLWPTYTKYDNKHIFSFHNSLKLDCNLWDSFVMFRITFLSRMDNNRCKWIFNESDSENMNENLINIILYKGILSYGEVSK